jgi:hypothetical protein
LSLAGQKLLEQIIQLLAIVRPGDPLGRGAAVAELEIITEITGLFIYDSFGLGFSALVVSGQLKKLTVVAAMQVRSAGGTFVPPGYSRPGLKVELDSALMTTVAHTAII